MAMFPISAGQVQFSLVAPVASDVFQNGVLLDGPFTVARTALAGGVGFLSGLLRTALGQIVTVDATAGLPAGTVYQNGLPLSPAGALCTSSGPAFTWQNGLPFAANGALSANVTGP